uniref:Uncharacterized protein n=1 Tax=Cacopsylla melanoneura TaxID=428564 RepID=A0A8D8U351_9HEMI
MTHPVCTQQRKQYHRGKVKTYLLEIQKHEQVENNVPTWCWEKDESIEFKTGKTTRYESFEVIFCHYGWSGDENSSNRQTRIWTAAQSRFRTSKSSQLVCL